VVDLGLSSFCSAGTSEEILGRALVDYADRAEIVLATKL
jgi:aryl-alcohol dehydrogenase-like predicted oxidoreductase